MMDKGKYWFGVRAYTEPGDSIWIVGGVSELGNWDVSEAIELKTDAAAYPLWMTPKQIDLSKYLDSKVEYKYVRKTSHNTLIWESTGESQNRCVPVEHVNLRVYDGDFGVLLSCPFGYEDPSDVQVQRQIPSRPDGCTIAVLGSSVAAGFSAWRLHGWAYKLGEALRSEYGHEVVNVSESGANVSTTLDRFNKVVTPLRPHAVIIALSLGNEGLFHCEPHDRNAAYARFMAGIKALVDKVRALPAIPIVAGIYPNGDCCPDAHMYFVNRAKTDLSERYPSSQRIEWFDALADSNGRWKAGLCTDPAHPNSAGHQVMFEAINRSIFKPEKLQAAAERTSSSSSSKSPPLNSPVLATAISNMVSRAVVSPIGNGTKVKDCEALNPKSTMQSGESVAGLKNENKLRNKIELFSLAECGFTLSVEFGSEDGDDNVILEVENRGESEFILNPAWDKLQNAFKMFQETKDKTKLPSGIYICSITDAVRTKVGSLAINSEGILDGGGVTFESNVCVRFALAERTLFSPESGKVLFYDGNISIVQTKEYQDCIRITNQTETEYNIHPMWREAQKALSVVESGVYDAVCDTHSSLGGNDFCTLLVGADGLQSRIRIGPTCSVVYKRTCALSDLNRIALVPLGARCAMRMLLHELQYDGPCYPFDLTRTTYLSDVSDIIYSDFQAMWDPSQLHYSDEQGRVYHSRWGGLSFAHEVEDGDDPINNCNHVFERMKTRYSKRAERFRFVMEHAPEVILLRTGESTRDEVADMMQKLHEKYPNSKFRLMLFSQQDSAEFKDMDGVWHMRHEMDPDRMNEEPQYRKYCGNVLKNELNQIGLSSRNLFWCPNNPQAALRAAARAASGNHTEPRDFVGESASGELSHLTHISSSTQLQRMFAAHESDARVDTCIPKEGERVFLECFKSDSHSMEIIDEMKPSEQGFEQSSVEKPQESEWSESTTTETKNQNPQQTFEEQNTLEKPRKQQVDKNIGEQVKHPATQLEFDKSPKEDQRCTEVTAADGAKQQPETCTVSVSDDDPRNIQKDPENTLESASDSAAVPCAAVSGPNTTKVPPKSTIELSLGA